MLRVDNIEYKLDAAGIRDAAESIRSDELPIGTKAPIFSLPNLNDHIVSLDNLLAIKKPIVLIFSDPGCGPCAAMMPSLVKWKKELSSELILVLMSRGTKELNMDKFNELDSSYSQMLCMAA